MHSVYFFSKKLAPDLKLIETKWDAAQLDWQTGTEMKARAEAVYILFATEEDWDTFNVRVETLIGVED